MCRNFLPGQILICPMFMTTPTKTHSGDQGGDLTPVDNFGKRGLTDQEVIHLVWLSYNGPVTTLRRLMVKELPLRDLCL